MSLIPCCSIGVREKILAIPSVEEGGKTNVHRYKDADWASIKKIKKLNLKNESTVVTSL